MTEKKRESKSIMLHTSNSSNNRNEATDNGNGSDSGNGKSHVCEFNKGEEEKRRKLVKEATKPRYRQQEENGLKGTVTSAYEFGIYTARTAMTMTSAMNQHQYADKEYK